MIRTIVFSLTVLSQLVANGQFSVAIDQSIGVTSENLNWSIAGNMNGESPNVLSELKWKDVWGVGYSGAVEVGVGRILVFSDIRQSTTISGNVTDTDYSQDDRRSIVFHANENAGKGGTTQFALGGGFQPVQSSKLTALILAGYGQLKQELYLVNAGSGLNSHYETSWKGPLVRTRLDVKLVETISIEVKCTYHQIHYSAKGNWNLIDEFQHPVSFRHKAKGFGLDADAAIVKKMTPRLSIFAGGRFSLWTTGKGIDTLYKTDQTTPKTRLNDVTRNASGIRVGLSLRVLTGT